MDVNTPGPGYYQAEKSDIAPIYKYKQTSVFASKVDRVGNRMRNSQSEMGNTHTLKGRIAAGVNSTNPLSPAHGVNPDDQDEDEYYEEEDDGTTPGPGAYFNP